MASKSDNHEKSQSERFIEAARELGADDTSEDRFKAAVRKIASAPPAKSTPRPRPKDGPKEGVEPTP